MRIFRSDLRIIMNKFEMSDKIELTALELVHLLDDAMGTLCQLYKYGQYVTPILIADSKVRELFKRRKEQSNENT